MLSIALVVVPFLVLVAGVLLLVGAVSPGRLRRIAPFLGDGPPARKRALLVFAPVFVALLAIEGVLLAQPRFETSLPEGHRVVAGESAGIAVAVKNTGLSDGDFVAPYVLDGVDQSDVSVRVPGSQTAAVTLPLPDDLEPGRHTILVGDTSFAIMALRPAAFSVSSLTSDTRLARTGERVTLTATVMNTGEAPGEFGGVLKADGRRCDAQPTTVGPGEQQTLTYTWRSSRQGKHMLRLGDARCAQIVVKPVHYENGHYLRRSASGGDGVLQVKNGNRVDGVVVLTRQSDRKVPVIACYIRARQSFKVTGIPDGKYWIYYSLGRDWNTYTDGFIEVQDRGRFSDLAKYTTTTWTTSWSDADYVYTQGHVRYSGWKITLNPVVGGTARTETVSESAFPRVH
jgi:hypothetical protein